MRLLEPLSGLKVAQGHLLVHLIFFCIMLSVDDEYCRNLKTSSELEEIRKVHTE